MIPYCFGRCSISHLLIEADPKPHWQDLLTEYSLLKEVDHPNVIKLLGACIDKAGPILLIMEFAEHGSLRSFLHLCRGGAGVALSGGSRGDYQQRVIEQTRPHQLTTKDLLCFSWQVGRGMEYLSKKKVNTSLCSILQPY